MDYKSLLRRKLLEDMYDKMSDEQKRTFIMLTMENKDHREIMDALRGQRDKLTEIDGKQSWVRDFSANLAANGVFDGFVWLAGKLFKKL